MTSRRTHAEHESLKGGAETSWWWESWMIRTRRVAFGERCICPPLTLTLTLPFASHRPLSDLFAVKGCENKDLPSYTSNPNETPHSIQPNFHSPFTHHLPHNGQRRLQIHRLRRPRPRTSPSEENGIRLQLPQHRQRNESLRRRPRPRAVHLYSLPPQPPSSHPIPSHSALNHRALQTPSSPSQPATAPSTSAASRSKSSTPASRPTGS